MHVPGGTTAARRRARASAGAVMVLVLVAGCGGSGASPTSARPSSVNVTLQEWAVIPDSTTVAAGEVTFRATNNGPADDHEMVVIKTDLPLLGLPVDADGTVDETATGVSTLGEIGDLPVGQSGTATFTLEPGNYLLICNIALHYGKGMTAALVVR